MLDIPLFRSSYDIKQIIAFQQVATFVLIYKGKLTMSKQKLSQNVITTKLASIIQFLYAENSDWRWEYTV